VLPRAPAAETAVSLDGYRMCVLRAHGVEFDVDQFLTTSSLEACAVWHRGEENRFLPKTRGPVNPDSGLNVEVSDGPWSDRAVQLDEVQTFLRANATEIQRLRAWPGVEEVVLDIPVELRIGEKIAVQSEKFSAEFIEALARVGLTLKITIWPPSSEGAV